MKEFDFKAFMEWLEKKADSYCYESDPYDAGEGSAYCDVLTTIKSNKFGGFEEE